MAVTDLLHNFIVKFKKLFLTTNFTNLTRSLAGILSRLDLLICFLMLKFPLGGRPTTSAVTIIESSGTFPILFIPSIKSPESGMYGQLLCIKGFK